MKQHPKQPPQPDNTHWNKPPNEWPTNTLLTELEQRYRSEPVPPCVVCGGPLSISAMGGGEPTVWACSPMEEDPGGEGRIRLKAGRSGADQHFSDSRYVQRRRGDDLVLEVAARLRAAEAQVAEGREVLAAFRGVMRHIRLDQPDMGGKHHYSLLRSASHRDGHKPFYEVVEVALLALAKAEGRM